jgi:methionyl-tRNA synthetase
MTRRILVTSALPYANGPIHLGHLVEYIQTDIWARFQRLRGHRCVYVCADDTHGTAIMIRARQEGRTEEALIADMSVAHQRDFAAFQIAFDHYGSTHSRANLEVCTTIWNALRREELIVEQDVTQLYDPEAGVFLADRFVKGTCPKCGAANQYGDNCDQCGATYSAADLIDATSTLSGARPEMRTASHLFIDVERRHEFLEQWVQEPGRLHPDVVNYLKGHFLSEPLRRWDVSRPAPYFGFEIPDAPGHYWYVWFDAPIGYIGATAEWCRAQGESLDGWWRSEQTEVHHFIGKDIAYFHTLFWPAMLQAAGFSLPTRVQVHGFLKVNGEKMSKSKGTFVHASTYLDHLHPSYLRYYYASKLSGRVDDLDLNPEEFVQKVNSDLVGKVVNLASRTARFVQETGLSPQYPDDEGLFAAAAGQAEEIAKAYEGADTARAMRLVMALADRANEYIDRKQPWALRKQPGREEEVQAVCTVGLNLLRQLAVYLAPVLPDFTRRCERLLNVPVRHWDDVKTPLRGTAVAPFEHMMTRVDPKAVQAMLAASVETEPVPKASTTAQPPTSPACVHASASPAAHRAPAPAPAAASSSIAKNGATSATCTLEDFERIDLRIAKIVAAQDVPEARKLVQLSVDLGEGRTRTVFAGIKAAYSTSDLVGRLVVVVANLAPRTMKFGVSEGMVLASGEGGSELFLLSPDEGAMPGQRVR